MPETIRSPEVEIALLIRSHQDMMDQIKELKQTVANIETKVDNIYSLLDMGRGGLFVMLTIGGTLAWIISQSDKIFKWFFSP